MIEEEIIIHKDQSTLEDYLKEDNPLCVKCRWVLSGRCSNKSCIDEHGKKIDEITIERCDNRYSEDDIELFSDEKTGSLL